MAIKLFDSELKVMDVLWKEGDKTAKQISDILKEEIGWNMNTTYTVIKKCIAKGAIERTEQTQSCDKPQHEKGRFRQAMDRHGPDDDDK